MLLWTSLTAGTSPLLIGGVQLTRECERCGHTGNDVADFLEPGHHGEYERDWFKLCRVCREIAWIAFIDGWNQEVDEGRPILN